MIYNLEFKKEALKEWNKLDQSIQEQFKKKIKKILQNPCIPSARLSGYNLNECYKIKLRQSGYRLEHVILIFVAAKMVLQAKFTIGMIFAFMSYRQSFSQKSVALVERIIEFRLLNLHLERISDIALEPQEEQGENELSVQQKVNGDIEFKNVTFSYAPDDPLVLDKVSFSIAAGETVAIVGKSGCGKTTLLKLATGLFKANQGDILIDGKELKEFGIANFRRQIGVIMQEDKLFSGSLADNIGFFDPEINMDLVLKCAKQAMIHDEIMQMPMKYESLIGDMGTALSGGQIQRVILARALYRKPKILFMDEGTAHLDVQTERAVIKSVAALCLVKLWGAKSF